MQPREGAMILILSGLCFTVNKILKRLDDFPRPMTVSNSRIIFQNYNFYILSSWKVSTPQSHPYFLLSGREMLTEGWKKKDWSREDNRVTELLVDTAKIRTLKLFSNTSKKWWRFVFLIIVQSLCSFPNCLELDKSDYMLSEEFLISHHFWNSLLW